MSHSGIMVRTAFYKDEPASKDEIEELRNAIEELEE